ncbi:hypothetical protein GLOIN_2v1511063 [Rhizophagus clarus]|uniref:Uncharacterized protein n=1 Tax=Rhizophagus clarus TaxID=94130 RepID=A0A8H3MEZ7_9GLOM|nr:hypothetical protein GLOIN_2v1511063 [Rhizophagus clarus]
MTKKDFQSYDLKGRPAMRLAKEAKVLKDNTKRPFSSSLSEEDNKHFVLCMVDVNLRLQSYGTLVMTSLESMRNEYVSEYEIIGDESCGRVDYAIKDEESLICVTEDKVQQKLTEGFAQNSMKRIRENESGVKFYRASKTPFSIEFTEESLVEDSEEYQTLRKG